MSVLLPGSDRAVLIQVVVAAFVFLLVLSATWRHRDGRTFVIGVGVVVLAWFGLRAVH